MKRFTIAFLLSIFFSAPAFAFTAGTGLFADYEFVADTEIPGPGGEMLSLCYITKDFRILGYTMTSDVQGYALGRDRCEAGIDRTFSTEQMETAQSLNLIAGDIPSEAKNSFERALKNYGLWGALALALIAVIIRRVKSLMGLDPKGLMRKKASARILSALCYVGKCDGIVASGEIALIRQTVKRLTRRDYPAADVIHITDHIDLNLTTQDYIDFGRGLRDSEKDTMMRGAFYVALATGRILPAEHEFLSNLAHGIGMPGEDFRRVMNLAIGDLDKYPPNL